MANEPIVTLRHWSVLATCAAALLAAAPAAAQDKVLRVTMHADVRTLDPIWTTQTIAGIHGMMIYDTLFSMNEKLEPKPQMVDTWTISDDRKTYTFTLRDGLKFHDGSPVESKDVIASMKRWGQRDGAGKRLMAFTDSITEKDSKTFVWRLKAPYGLVLDTLGKPGTSFPFVMREEEAKTDPFQQISEVIGSGPFTFARDQWVPGSKTVYNKFKDYKPRAEPASGHAGGKDVKVDRVEFVWLSDPQTARAALEAGEIHFLENPQIDFLPMLEANSDVKLISHPARGSQGIIQLNHLHPPFNNIKARQAMLSIVKVEDYLRTIAGDPKNFKECYSMLGCGHAMSTDAGSEPLQKVDLAKAEQLFKEAGYKGEPLTILHATDHNYINPANLVLQQQLRQAKFLKLDVQAMDWGQVVARRAKKEPPSDGGWNIFITGTSVIGASNPVTHVSIGAGCEKAWFGWPCDSALEKLRNDWALAPDIETRKQIAIDLHKRAMEVVPYIPFGQWVTPSAYRSDLIDGVLSVTGVPPMWNISLKQ